MTNPLYCATCTQYGEVGKLASFVEQTESGELRICHHCHWLMMLQVSQQELMQCVLDMRKETLEIMKLVNQVTAKVAVLSQRFAGNN